MITVRLGVCNTICIYELVQLIKSEAVRYEKWLKSGVGRDFIKQLNP